MEVEQLRVVDKGFTPENPVSIFEICGGDLCGGGVGKRVQEGYRDGLHGAVAGYGRAVRGLWCAARGQRVGRNAVRVLMNI